MISFIDEDTDDEMEAEEVIYITSDSGECCDVE